MRTITIFLICAIIHGAGFAAECPDGYTLTENGECTITCQPGFFVETPGGQCTEITENTTYTDAPHTITYGETSSAYLKHCPRTADGERGGIPNVFLHVNIRYCAKGVLNIRMQQRDRYNSVNCDKSDIHSCVWLTHGVGRAVCYYTTGADGTAIYDNRITDPVTGESRTGCVGGSWLTECDAGYYAPYESTGEALQYHPCNPVGTAYWSPDKDLNRYACPAGTATCGFGECADSADDCLPYRIMKIDGFGDVLLWPVKRSQKALAVMYPDGSVYYGMMTPVAQPRGLHVQYPDGKIYTVLSPTDSFVTYETSNLVGGYKADVLMYDEKE